MVEDIINQEPFVGYLEWRVGEGLPWDGPLVPSVGAGACGWQTGGGSEPQSGPATPGLLWFGDGGALCRMSTATASTYIPFGAATLLDDDLKFAAASMVLHYCADG